MVVGQFGRICSTKKDRPVGFPINAKPEPGRGGRRWIVDVNWLVGIMTWLVRSTDCARAGSSVIVSCASTLVPRYLPSLPSGALVLDYSHSIVLQDSASALESVRAAAKLFPAPSIEAYAMRHESHREPVRPTTTTTSFQCDQVVLAESRRLLRPL